MPCSFCFQFWNVLQSTSGTSSAKQGRVRASSWPATVFSKWGTRCLCLWHPGNLIKEAASRYLTVFFTASPAHHYLQNSQTSKFKIKSTWWNPWFQVLVLPSIISWTKDVLQRPVALTTVQKPYLLGATLTLVKPTPPGPHILRLVCVGLSFDFRKSPERT